MIDYRGFHGTIWVSNLAGTQCILEPTTRVREIPRDEARSHFPVGEFPSDETIPLTFQDKE